jgi:hypothetical protein
MRRDLRATSRSVLAGTFSGYGNEPHHVPGRLVFTDAVEDHLAEQVVVSPGQVGDLDDHLRPDPMHAGEDERRAEPGALRRAHVERHLSRGERFKRLTQPAQLVRVHAGPGPTGVNETGVRGVVGEEQRAEIRTRALRVRPANQDFQVAGACP